MVRHLDSQTENGCEEFHEKKERLCLARVILGVTDLEGEGDIFEIMGLYRDRLGVSILQREIVFRESNIGGNKFRGRQRYI